MPAFSISVPAHCASTHFFVTLRLAKKRLLSYTIPKGTKIYRTTSTENDSDSGTTYVSYLDIDRNHYKGGWIRSTGNTGKAYEHTYELQEDIKVPSREDTRKVIAEVMKENRNLINETAKAWLDVAIPEGSMERIERMWSNANNEKEAKREWERFAKETIDRYKKMSPDEAVFFTMQSLGLNPKVKEKVIKKLSEKGYNAMTDEASVGGQNGYQIEGGDPLIIFDRTNMFKEVSNKEVSRREEKKADNRYSKARNKARRNRNGSW